MLKQSTILKSKTLLFIAVIFTLTAGNIYSQTPSAPIWLNYTGVEHDSINDVFSVDLQWRHGEVTNEIPLPDSYNIYRVLVGHSDDNFQMVGTHNHNSENEMQFFTDENIKDEAVYYYYVKAIKDGNESDESRRMMAVVPGSYCVNMNAEIIDFISSPLTIGVPGETYEYSAFAKHRSLRVQGWVRYALEEGPKGMEIDNETGLLTWDIPFDAEGEYYVKIKATSDDDKNALSEQEWYIRIASDMEIQVMASVEEAVRELQVYPIPAINNLFVNFNTDYYNNKIELIDILGNVVYSSDMKNNVGSNAVELNLSNFADGVYTLRISNNLGVSHKKIIVGK